MYGFAHSRQVAGARTVRMPAAALAALCAVLVAALGVVLALAAALAPAVAFADDDGDGLSRDQLDEAKQRGPQTKVYVYQDYSTDTGGVAKTFTYRIEAVDPVDAPLPLSPFPVRTISPTNVYQWEMTANTPGPGEPDQIALEFNMSAKDPGVYSYKMYQYVEEGQRLEGFTYDDSVYWVDVHWDGANAIALVFDSSLRGDKVDDPGWTVRYASAAVKPDSRPDPGPGVDDGDDEDDSGDSGDEGSDGSGGDGSKGSGSKGSQGGKGSVDSPFDVYTQLVKTGDAAALLLPLVCLAAGAAGVWCLVLARRRREEEGGVR